jgi:HTH-type transcriptional regulator, sugar sensing transcriptional regulator
MSTKELELLIDLGLTTSEAKVYLALIKYGLASAEKIAQTAEIARERVYVLMPILRKKGLVEEIIASPKLFEAVPMNIGLKILLNIEKERMKTHQTIAIQLLEKTAVIPQHLEDKFKISLIPSGQMVPLTVDKACEDAVESINLIVKEKNLQYNIDQFPEQASFKEIVEKGVVYKIITDSAPKSRAVLNALKGTHIRVVQEIGLGLNIIDNKRIFMRLSNEPKWDKCQMLYMENTAIADIFNKYFKNMWLNAKPV